MKITFLNTVFYSLLCVLKQAAWNDEKMQTKHRKTLRKENKNFCLHCMVKFCEEISRKLKFRNTCVPLSYLSEG